MAVKKYKLTKANKKINSIGLLSQVKTPHGVGIVVEIGGLDANGLYFLAERAKYLVWYGVESDHTEWNPDPENYKAKHIAYWYKAEQLELLK